MRREQLENFIYSCLSFANKSHFDEERHIKSMLDKSLAESSFSEVIMRNYKIANNYHLGVCFTMTCWAYHLLYTMGIESGYYILETVEKETGFPNYVLLYEIEGEYRICDLAAQVQAIEKVHETLFQIGRNRNNYKKEFLDTTLNELASSQYICQSLQDYYKNYNGGLLIYANGIDDDRIFTEIPQVSLLDFLKKKNGPMFK